MPQLQLWVSRFAAKIGSRLTRKFFPHMSGQEQKKRKKDPENEDRLAKRPKVESQTEAQNTREAHETKVWC